METRRLMARPCLTATSMTASLRMEATTGEVARGAGVEVGKASWWNSSSSRVLEVV